MTLKATTQQPAPSRSAPTLDFDHVTLANEYGFYCAPTDYRQREIIKLLRAGKVYEPDTLKFLRRQVGQGDIISGGAFIGDFFPALREAMAADAVIHSFEPNPMSLEAALETIRLNELNNVQLHPVAVGEAEGQLTLQVARADGTKIAAGARIVSTPAMDNKFGIQVDVVTLDSLVPADRDISILHLDIEGFEIIALNGASRILNEQKPLVLLEAGKAWKRKACIDRLNQLAPDAGYQLCGSIEHNAIFRPA